MKTKGLSGTRAVQRRDAKRNAVPMILNFDKPAHARQYLAGLRCSANGKPVMFVQLESGRYLWFRDMTDEEACHYAREIHAMTQGANALNEGSE